MGIVMRGTPLTHAPMLALQILRAWRDPSNVWPHYQKPYQFTEDWFTSRIPTWKVHLKSLAGRPALRALEIGVHEGRSSLWLLENILTEPDARLVCIDEYRHKIPVEPRFRANLKTSGHEAKVEVHVGRSEEILPHLPPQSFDLAHLDGSHLAPQVLADAQLTWPLVKDGGLMILDDYLWEGDLPPEQRPRRGIDDFLRLIQGQFEVIHWNYQVIIQKLV